MAVRWTDGPKRPHPQVKHAREARKVGTRRCKLKRQRLALADWRTENMKVRFKDALTTSDCIYIGTFVLARSLARCDLSHWRMLLSLEWVSVAVVGVAAAAWHDDDDDDDD